VGFCKEERNAWQGATARGEDNDTNLVLRSKTGQHAMSVGAEENR